MPFVRCNYCDGTGVVKLTGVWADTLALLRQHGREVAGADLARVAKCQATAMCNRLVALERLGLATSRRYGRKRLFRPIDTPE